MHAYYNAHARCFGTNIRYMYVPKTAAVDACMFNSLLLSLPCGAWALETYCLLQQLTGFNVKRSLAENDCVTNSCRSVTIKMSVPLKMGFCCYVCVYVYWAEGPLAFSIAIANIHFPKSHVCAGQTKMGVLIQLQKSQDR